MAVKKTILVVDDDETVGELIQDILQSESEYRIFRAMSGSDAYAKIKNAKIDFVCTDFRMPKMTGVELYSLVRSSKLNSQIPMLFLSGNIEDVRMQVKNDNMVDFLGKPFDGDMLIQMVKNLFARSEAPDPVATTVSESSVRPQVDVSIMNQFINATLSTLTNMVDLQDVKNDPVRSLAKNDNPVPEVSGIIQISCQKFNGSLIVGFPEQTLLGISNKMLGEQKKVVDEDVAGTAGELVNIIWGRTKTLLESQKLEFTNTLPTVFQGTNRFMSAAARAMTLEVPFKTELGDFHVVFTINY